MKVTKQEIWQVELSKKEVVTIKDALDYTIHRMRQHGKCNHISAEVVDDIRKGLQI